MNTSMNATLKESVSDQLVNDLKKVAEDANRLIKDVGNYPAERMSEARNQLEEKFRFAQLKAEHIREGIVDKTKHTADVTHQYVIDNPWKSLAILATATAVLALLLTRR
jgi:ElaB/YqjD/DUF883 family membrane-anchored ribosome-binding protein